MDARPIVPVKVGALAHSRRIEAVPVPSAAHEDIQRAAGRDVDDRVDLPAEAARAEVIPAARAEEPHAHLGHRRGHDIALLSPRMRDVFVVPMAPATPVSHADTATLRMPTGSRSSHTAGSGRPRQR